jgi:hypothetical protein
MTFLVFLIENAIDWLAIPSAVDITPRFQRTPDGLGFCPVTQSPLSDSRSQGNL